MNCDVYAVQVAHVTPDVAFLQQKNGVLAHDWAAAQVATTADFAHGSFFWTHFSGGLNYQVSSRLMLAFCGQRGWSALQNAGASLKGSGI